MSRAAVATFAALAGGGLTSLAVVAIALNSVALAAVFAALLGVAVGSLAGLA